MKESRNGKITEETFLQGTEVNGYKIYNGDLMNKIGNNVMTPL